MRDYSLPREPSRPLVQVRVFTLTAQDVEATPEVIQGTLYISGFSARVLIDPKATHSFISHMFASRLEVKPIVLDYMLTMSTPTSGALGTNVIYRACG